MAGVEVHVGAKTDKAVRELQSFQKKTQSIAKSIARGFKERIGHKIFDGLKSAVRQIPEIMMDAVNAASDMNEELGKSEAVFGKFSKSVIAWSKTTTMAFGISRGEALQATGTMGNMLRAFGITGDEASKMSMKLVELAGDFASFNNATVEDTIYAIGAALRGESEPIRKYAVDLNDATLKAKAFDLGLYNGEKALSANAKALAAYNIILDETKNQQGDAARTSGNLAGQKRILTAQIKDLQVEIGEKLLPVFSDLITKLNQADFEEIADDVGTLASAFADLTEFTIKATKGWMLFAEGFGEAKSPEWMDKMFLLFPMIKVFDQSFKAYSNLGKTDGFEFMDDPKTDSSKDKQKSPWGDDFEKEWAAEKKRRAEEKTWKEKEESMMKEHDDRNKAAIHAERERLELLEKQRQEKEKALALEKAQEGIDRTMGQVGEIQSGLNSAMTRSSITAVSSMQAIGGGGGVSGELNLQKTQTDLQRQLVVLNKELVDAFREQAQLSKQPVSQ